MRLLLCTDGSPDGHDAVRFGAILARRSPEEATILGVLETPAYRRRMPAKWLRLSRELAEAKRFLAGAPQPRSVMRRGHAAEEIFKETRSGAYDLVAVGARGRRGLSHLLLGSTAEQIARRARIPVLIVHEPPDAITHVLVCIAGKEPGFAAVRCGGEVARLVGADVTVLHVMSQIAAEPALAPDVAKDLKATAPVLIDHHTREGILLEEAVALLDGLGVAAHPTVRHGLVVDEILDEAREGAYDLVVIGAHSTTGMMGFLLDDVAHQIINHIERPVLVARSRSS